MSKVVSKFQIQMLKGNPVIKMFDNLVEQNGAIITVESESIADNVKQILSYVYEMCGDFDEGYATVRRGNHWGLIDMAFKEVIKPEYQDMSSVNEGFAIAKQLNKYYYFKLANCELPVRWNDQGYDSANKFSNGMALVNKNGFYGYISNKLPYEEAIPCAFEHAYDFDNVYPHAVVKIDGKYGMIDKSGKAVIDPIFDTYSPYSQRLDNSRYVSYNATIGDKYYMLNSNGTYKEVE